MPVLPVGGDHSYGAQLAADVGFAAGNVQSAVIKDSGHWIRPEQAVALILSFLGASESHHSASVESLGTR
jgi:hypothetical protein